MVEKIVQVEADIQDKEETGVESALYIFGPSLMSEEVGFGTAAQPLDTDPRPPSSSIVRNMPETLPTGGELWLFSAPAGYLRKHERSARMMT